MRSLLKIDWWIFLPAVFLSSLGGLILSSVAPSSFPQQFFFWGIALFLFLGFALTDVRILREISPFLYVSALVLLAITFFFGEVAQGAARWIFLGPISLQPSELVKPFLVIFFAYLVCLNAHWNRFVFLAGAAFLPFFLIFLQPDLGSSLVILAAFVGVAFFGGFNLKVFGLLLLVFVIVAPFGRAFLADYQRERIEVFFTPAADPLGAGYNSIQSMIAVGSGELFGQGLGQGGQSQLAFLPERHTDFIFAALSEELGFLGSVFVVFAFFVLLGRIVVIMKNNRDIFSQSLLGGIFMVLFAHVAVNIGMNLGILPITGIPLPLVSSGGSSLVATAIMLGIVSSVSSSLKLNPESNIM